MTTRKGGQLGQLLVLLLLFGCVCDLVIPLIHARSYQSYLDSILVFVAVMTGDATGPHCFLVSEVLVGVVALVTGCSADPRRLALDVNNSVLTWC